MLFLVFISAYSASQLVDDINTKHLRTLEDVIAQLPAELLSNYTLQHRGGGLQEGSWENPRAILFGDDAKFIVTFNGSPLQNMGNALEIMQFDDATQQFELYQIDFPIVGKAQLPQKNPAACMQCHSTPERSAVFPIWGSYPFWKGAYGSSDDQLWGAEASAFNANAAAWQQHARYKFLRPDEGSPVAPFSTIEVQTYSFRPNATLGSYLVRLNAKALAARVKQTAGFETLLLLASPSFFHCRNKIDLPTLDRALAAQPRAFAEKPAYTLENVAFALGTDTFAWGMREPHSRFTDPYFLDGYFQTTPNYVMAELATAFFTKYPKLQAQYEENPVYPQTVNQDRLARTDHDRAILSSIDRLGVPWTLKKASCDDFVDYLKAEALQ